MSGSISQFESVLITQRDSLNGFIDIQPTTNDVMMKQAKDLINEGIQLAIQGSKGVKHGNVQA